MSSKISHAVFWKIKNFDRDFIKNKKEHYSSDFKVIVGNNQTVWYLGIKQNVQGFLAIYLYSRVYDFNTFTIAYILGILNAGGGVPKEQGSERAASDFTKDLSGWGWSEFISYDELFNPIRKYCADNTLSITCRMDFSFDQQYSELRDVQILKLSTEMKRMLLNDKLADFSLEARDGKQFKTHKSIISAQSSFFSDAITGGKKGLIIDDFDSKIIREVLRFIYCGNVEDLDGNVLELIQASQKFKMDGLKDYCINHLMKSLNPLNAIQAFKFAENCHDTLLSRKCVDIIAENYFSLCKKPEWNELDNVKLNKIIDYIMSKPGLEVFV